MAQYLFIFWRYNLQSADIFALLTRCAQKWFFIVESINKAQKWFFYSGKY